MNIQRIFNKIIFLFVAIVILVPIAIMGMIAPEAWQAYQEDLKEYKNL